MSFRLHLSIPSTRLVSVTVAAEPSVLTAQSVLTAPASTTVLAAPASITVLTASFVGVAAAAVFVSLIDLNLYIL